MEWLVLIFMVAAPLGWWLGHRRGVEEGAQAAFQIEFALCPAGLNSNDRALVLSIFKEVPMYDPIAVGSAAKSVGEAYRNIIRREAFETCPYEAGYLQAIKDVMAGAAEMAKTGFDADSAAELINWIDESQRESAGPPAGFYLEQYNPNGQLLGLDLIRTAILYTVRRVRKEQQKKERQGDTNSSDKD